MIPYRIDNVLERTPWMNWLLLGATTAISALLWSQPDAEGLHRYFVLGDGSPVALVGHLFAHAGALHLLGNLVFLWVFGNGVCAMVGNFTYGAFYLIAGAAAGLVHLAVDGHPLIGASGAINGVVAAALAFFPFTRVSIFYVLGFRVRFAQIALWMIALYWVTYDVVHGYLGQTNVAHFAHLGGFGVGLAAGLLLLAIGHAQLSQYDERSLLDVFRGRRLEDVQRERAGDRPELFVVPTVVVATDTAPAPRPTPIKLRAAGTPPPLPTAPAAEANAADCFVFDGRQKLGPLTPFDAAEKIRAAADTTGWLYWQQGMAQWEPVPARAPALVS